MISSFSGGYSFLGNFYPCEIKYEGIDYPSSEHAFQAAKTHNMDERRKISYASSAGKAKRMGRKLVIRRDWDHVRIGIMEAILRIKFADPELKRLLLQTDSEELVEGNTWGDRFWGVCDGEGENHLGKLLMKIRAEIKNEESRK